MTRRAHEERGQILMLTALFAASLLGLAGLVIDGGRLYQQRRDLQNAADAGAAAAAQVLLFGGSDSEARSAAQWYTDENGINVTEVEINIPPEDGPYAGRDGYVEVIVEAEPEALLIRALTAGSYTVRGRAVAGIGSLEATDRFLPWGLTEDNGDCLSPGNPPRPRYGSSCVLKLGAGDGRTGDYGALDPDGQGGGSNEYRDNIIDGEVDTVYRIGDEIDALPGNKTGPTDQGIDARLRNEPSSNGGATCDTNGNRKDDFSETLIDRGAGESPRYIVRPACKNSPRLIVIPIVDQIDHPQESEIQGWALMYLESYRCVDDPSNRCNGRGHWEVRGTIVDAVWSDYDGFMGEYVPQSSLSAWFLAE
ncbi:MAG TPA: Tad domain-containing protein [Dehalococcoidia bacterium]|nr:Tad domain-containing protein [Dehalococcoidia bacterium]